MARSNASQFNCQNLTQSHLTDAFRHNLEITIQHSSVTSWFEYWFAENDSAKYTYIQYTAVINKLKTLRKKIISLNGNNWLLHADNNNWHLHADTNNQNDCVFFKFLID